MSKEVAKKQSTEVGQAMDLSEWGPSPMSSKELVIPYISLMQGTSDAVIEGKAAFGEFRDSLTNKKLGDLKTGFQIIPFSLKKIWVEYDVTNPKKPKFFQVVNITPENEDLPFEGMGERTEAGKTTKFPLERIYTLNFYCLLPEEVKRGGEIPYILPFRSSSRKEGNKLATQMYVTNFGGGLPPAGLVIEIRAKKVSNDDNTWAIPEVVLDPEFTRLASVSRTEDGKLDPRSELGAALKWYKQVSANQVKEHTEAVMKGEEVVVSADVEKGPAKF